MQPLAHSLRPRFDSAPRRPLGFTLIEMLVAMVITLVMMAAVMTMFGLVGDSVSGSRATIEMSERLRSCRNRLQADLIGATAPTYPPLRPEEDQGFLEYVEGPAIDRKPVIYDELSKSSYTVDVAINGNMTLFGDTDDVLALTVRSRGEPFVGKAPTGIVESPVAEVIWYWSIDVDSASGLSKTNPPKLVHTDSANTTFSYPLGTLYRRVLLVVPRVDLTSFIGTATEFFQKYDISAHFDPTSGKMIANTLGDLTKRENRYAHDPDTFPHAIKTTLLPANPHVAPLLPFDQLSGRLGEDVILTNVLAFDVKAYDPTCEIRQSNDGSAVIPSDPGYDVKSLTVIGAGAFVDLDYGEDLKSPYNASYFSGPPQKYGPSHSSLYPFIAYDTWSLHYEDGQLGSNGLDDDGKNGVDDPGEAVAPPPYAAPLRGIQIKIREYETHSRQVREVTVVQDFLPE